MTTSPKPLAEFVRPLASVLHYCQSRQSLERCVTGLPSDLGCKNCDIIA
jgi:hypothetical protein